MAITSQAVQAKRDLRIGDKIFTFLKYFLLILFSIIALIPVSVCVLTAFKTTAEYNTTNVLTPPQNWLNFDNFVTAFERANMLRGFLNTGIALVFVLLFSILISSMLAYVLNRFRFPGSGLIHNLFMFASLIPGIATQVTVYQIMFSLGLINHLYGYILVLCGTDIISIYIFLQFFENLPRALDESAILDGCTYIGVFRGKQTNGIPYIYLGRSADGIHWTFDPEKIPFVNEKGEPAMPVYAYDPRLVKVEDTYYIIWCQDFYGASIGLAKTTDFKTFTRLENPFVPFNRNAVLFPRKINGMYVMLSRPSDSGHTPFGDIFLSQSPDMEFWGRHRHVMSKSSNWWENVKIGGGAAPIETSEGWLLFYHGVTGTCNGFVYSIGGAILDRDDPSKVLYRCGTFLLTPEAEYEERGFVPNVCFPCATLQDAATGRIALYYGCADSYVGLAFTTADEVVDYIKAHDNAGPTDWELGVR